VIVRWASNSSLSQQTVIVKSVKLSVIWMWCSQWDIVIILSSAQKLSYSEWRLIDSHVHTNYKSSVEHSTYKELSIPLLEMSQYSGMDVSDVPLNTEWLGSHGPDRHVYGSFPYGHKPQHPEIAWTTWRLRKS